MNTAAPIKRHDRIPIHGTVYLSVYVSVLRFVIPLEMQNISLTGLLTVFRKRDMTPLPDDIGLLLSPNQHYRLQIESNEEGLAAPCPIAMVARIEHYGGLAQIAFQFAQQEPEIITFIQELTSHTQAGRHL